MAGGVRDAQIVRVHGEGGFVGSLVAICGCSWLVVVTSKGFEATGTDACEPVLYLSSRLVNKYRTVLLYRTCTPVLY